MMTDTKYLGVQIDDKLQWDRHIEHVNPIVVGLFDSTILVGGGAKKPPYLTLDW